MEKTTITVQEDTLERFNRLKQEATAENMPEQSANLFLKSLMDTWEAVDSGHYDETPDGISSELQEISSQLDQIESAQANTVSESLRLADESIEQLKDELSMANEPTADVDVEGLYDELDKLKALVERVPEDTAEELGSEYL